MIIVSNDELALRELFEASPHGGEHLFRHYLYFPVEQACAEATDELRRIGFTAEKQPSAFDENWLALASHKMVLSNEAIASIREQMEALATKFGGEYDGWDAEVLG